MTTGPSSISITETSDVEDREAPALRRLEVASVEMLYKSVGEPPEFSLFPAILPNYQLQALKTHIESSTIASCLLVLTL